jgi:hypothetical protein
MSPTIEEPHMYSEETTRLPTSEEDFWRLLRDNYDYAEMVLTSAVEDESEALDPVDTEESRQRKSLKAIGAVIPFRGTTEGLDNRDHFLATGRELLPYIRQALEEQAMTLEFVQQWGKLMFCHGFIASYILDDSDPLVQKRAGFKTGKKRSKATQRKWLAHVLLRLIGEGKTRDQAEDIAVACVTEIIERGDFPLGFGSDWFKPIITYGGLAATYNAKHFFVSTMQELIKEPTNDIPPIPAIP